MTSENMETQVAFPIEYVVLYQIKIQLLIWFLMLGSKIEQKQHEIKTKEISLLYYEEGGIFRRFAFSIIVRLAS